MIQIADIFGMVGMACFLGASIKQLHKIIVTHHTTAISKTHYRLKIVAIICTLIMCYLTGLWLSFTVVGIELFVSFWIIHLLNKYRGKKTNNIKGLDVDGDGNFIPCT